MLPRILRVTRAKHQTKSSTLVSKTHNKNQNQDSALPGAPGTHKYKASSKLKSLSGRANKLFGRAGAAHLSRSGKEHRPESSNSRLSESMVFEGYRASEKQKGRTIKMKGSGRKQGKPKTRSSRRGAAFKASGGKKASS